MSNIENTESKGTELSDADLEKVSGGSKVHQDVHGGVSNSLHGSVAQSTHGSVANSSHGPVANITGGNKS
jgi:hypothetical protein